MIVRGVAFVFLPLHERGPADQDDVFPRDGGGGSLLNQQQSEENKD
jgi:hypothetical protein